MTDDENLPPVPRLEEQICFAVHAAAHAFAGAYRPLLEPLGLTYPQYLVLLRLWQEDGPTVKALGEPLFLDSGTLTPLLKRMEAAGLVTRQRDPRDERQVRIYLTDKGRGMREAARGFAAVLGCAMDLPLPELAALRDRLRLIGGRLRGRGDSAD